jgi:hypothetical protein
VPGFLLVFNEKSRFLGGGHGLNRVRGCGTLGEVIKPGDFMMPGSAAFNWIRVVVAVILAELLPILLLVAIVFVYGAIRQSGSLTPQEFAPRAGMWVGPIGGFLATLLFAWRTARRAPEQKIVHGTAVGVGTALLDLGLGILLGGAGAIQPVFFLSNGGRILAGVLGGWLATRRSGDDSSLSLWRRG